MGSSSSDAKVQPDLPADKTEDVIVSVRLRGDADKVIRRAAVEVDTSRSEFMATAALERAYEVLKQRRSVDAA